jgi:hypothetical protein
MSWEKSMVSGLDVPVKPIHWVKCSEFKQLQSLRRLHLSHRRWNSQPGAKGQGCKYGIYPTNWKKHKNICGKSTINHYKQRWMGTSSYIYTIFKKGKMMINHEIPLCPDLLFLRKRDTQMWRQWFETWTLLRFNQHVALTAKHQQHLN